MTWSGFGHRVNQFCSTGFAIASARFVLIGTISNHPVAGSVIVIAQIVISSLPFFDVSVWGPIKSAHSVCHGATSAVLAGDGPHFSADRFVLWHWSHFLQTRLALSRMSLQWKCWQIVSRVLVSPG